MRAIVTGGAGFIGSHLVDALTGRGDAVVILDDFSSGRRENLASALGRGAVIAEGSISDRERVFEIFGQVEPEAAFHLAAQVDVRRSVANPELDARINVLGTINVLDAINAQRSRPSLTFASTGGAIYGEGEGRPLPLAEQSALAPEAPYGMSKLVAEQYLALYRRLHGLRCVALRFGNVYGPRQDPHGEAGVVAIFSGLLREGKALRVYGDGSQTRDYVYVEDVVEALLAADDHLRRSRAGLGDPLNVGTGLETSVLELVERLGSAAGSRPEVDLAPRRPGEVARISIDPSAAASAIGWRPTTDLDAGLRRTYDSLAAAAADSV